MVKISQLPQLTAPTTADKVPLVSGGVTDYIALSDLITLFFNNIPTGAHSDVTRGSEASLSFVASGGVWSADNAGVNRNASMTAMIIYINGRRISISAVTSRTFTASKDTYVDVLDNADGTGTLVYTEATNNAASAALAANSTRIAIIVTGATTIAAAASVNQGQEDRILPIASSIPYAVTDSIGNLICPRDPNRRVLGYRQITSNATQTSGTASQVIGLSAPIIVPAGRKVRVSFCANDTQNSIASDYVQVGIWDGVVASGTRLALTTNQAAANGQTIPTSVFVINTPTATSKTYNVGLNIVVGGTATIEASATSPAFILVELV